jgi:hypothetical protein
MTGSSAVSSDSNTILRAAPASLKMSVNEIDDEIARLTAQKD